MKFKLPHPKTIEFRLSKFLYRFGIIPTVIYEGGTFYYQPTSIMGEKLFWMGGSELQEIELLKTFIKPDSIVLDIGGNVGGHAIAFATVCPSGKVFAFEPQPNTYKILEKNCRRFANATAFPYAISDENGQAVFHQTIDSGFSTLLENEQKNKSTKNFSTYTVIVKTLDYLIENDEKFKGIKKVDLIKIDVEGAEEKVIKGALKTIQKFHPIIMCEINGENNSVDAVDKVKKITSLGYTAYVFKDKRLEPFQYHNVFYYNYFFIAK